MKKIISLILLAAAVVVPAHAFNVEVTNMVGIPAGSTSSIVLPEVIKANSNWRPLFKVVFSSDDLSETYDFQQATITLADQNPNNFDPSIDLNDTPIKIFNDNNSGELDDQIWDEANSEDDTSASVILSITGSTSYYFRLNLDNSKAIDTSDRDYTFYFCIKTSDQIVNDDAFNVKWTKVGDLVFTLESKSDIQNLDYYTITGNTADNTDTLTADTVAPVIDVASYNPDADDGTTSSVENQDTNNVYKVSNTSNTIDIYFDLGEQTATLDPGDDYVIEKLVRVSSPAILGSAGSATKTFTDLETNEWELEYTINSSTINQNTDGTNPIAFPIRVRDAAGNWSSVDSSFEIYIDSKTPDATVINSPATDVWISTVSPKVEWAETTEAHFTEYGYRMVVATSSDFAGNRNRKNFATTKVKSSLPDNGPSNWDLYNLGALISGKNYYIGIGVKDDAEHITETNSLISEAIKINYDRQVPNVDWDTFAAGTTSTGTATPSVTAYLGDYKLSGVNITTIVMKLEDNNGVKRVISTSSYTSSYDAGTDSYTVTYTPPAALDDGKYRLSINVADEVSNYSGETSGGWFRIDTESPILVDSDNDGTTDLKEKADGTDWLDATDGASMNNWPIIGQKVNYAALVAGNNSKLNIWTDDPTQNDSSSSIDLDKSTVTVTLNGTTYIYGANDAPYPKQDEGSPSGTGYNSSSFTVQLPKALKKDGSDDGTLTITIDAEDNVGNKSATITRTFIYDNTAPSIVAVSTPALATNVENVTLSVDATDDNGISAKTDAVKLIVVNESINSLSKSTSTDSRYYMTITLSAGTYDYYFTAEDYAGNISTYPAGADSSPDQALSITVTDGKGPWAVIGNDTGGAGDSQTGEPDSYIKTLVGVNTSGITTKYNYASTPSVDDIPNVYSASNNILQATLEDDAANATFQYKASSDTSWTDLTTSESSLSQVYQATWNTTGLAADATYEIRIKSEDNKENLSTPSSVNSPGWVQVRLKAPLGPKAKIDTAQNDEIVGDGQSVRKYALLTASAPGATGNVDVSSVTFQYKSSSGGSWTDIVIDNDPSSVDKTEITFRFDLSDLPSYIQANTLTLDTSTIESVEFNCTTDNTYDREMVKSGNGWEETLSFPPGTYDYQFSVTYTDGSSDSFRDINEQDNDGGTDSRIIIDEYTALWDVTGLNDGSYQVRAVAKDSRGVADSTPEHITMKVDKTAPASVAITQPTASENRLQSGAATTLTAEVGGSDTTEGVFFLYTKENGKILRRIAAEDTSNADGWNQSWSPGDSLKNDANWKIEAYAYDESGNIVSSGMLDVVIDATDPEIASFSINKTTDTELDLNYGTSYSWTVTTLDADIEELILDDAGIGVEYSWNPGDNINTYTGSGTAGDPYKFTGTLRPGIDLNEDNQSDTITVILTDQSGRTDAKNIVVDLKDITPSEATIKSIDGFDIRAGEKITTSDRFITVETNLDVDDDGILKYQYRPSGGSWATWATDSSPDDGDSKILPPEPNNGIILSDGDYDLRILCIDDDGNGDPTPAEVTITVDSSLPDIKPASIISTNYNVNAGTLGAVEYDEIVDRVLFEYRLSGETTWNTLDTDTVVDTNYGNAGAEWSRSAAAFAAGTYEVRAIAEDTGYPAAANDSDTPVSTLLIKQDAAGKKIYQLNPETALSLSLGNPSFSSTDAGTENTLTAVVGVNSSQNLSDVSARMVMKDGAGNIDRYLTISGSSGSYWASADLSDIVLSGGAGRIVVNATDASGDIITSQVPFAVAASGNSPVPTAGRVTTAWTDTLEHNSAMALLPSAKPVTPASQSSLISAVGEPWDFILSDPNAFEERDPDGNEIPTLCNITFTYSDNELGAVDESKLGIAYWDAENSKWSSKGITNVTRDLVNNSVTFNTDHFSEFTLAAINTEPESTFNSPAEDGTASGNPLIDIDIDDGFSAIRSVKIAVDGTDQTAWFNAITYRDGIDNDGNGLIDEDTINAGGTAETPLNQSGKTGAKYKVKAPLQLSEGEHTITLTATNEQGVSCSKSITFSATSAVEIRNPISCPNPFNPNNGVAHIEWEGASDSEFTIKVFDFSGREVYSENIGSNITLTEWNGRDDSGNLLANGVYFMKIIADDGDKKDTETLKIAILR